MNKKKVTIIIPTYNRAKYINRAIDSILKQTYENIEIIVVDDNGKGTQCQKETEQKLKKYIDLPNFIYLIHNKNKNGAAARNTGIKRSSGEYITFLDDDDYFFPTRIGTLVDKIENCDSECVYSHSIILNKGKTFTKCINKNGNAQLDMLLQKSFFGTGSNMFFKAKALKSINGFDESFLRNQDIEVMVRFFEKYSIDFVDEILVVKDNSDRTNELNPQKSYFYRKHFLNSFKEIINKFPIKTQKLIYKTNYVDLIRISIKGKNKDIVRTIRKDLKNEKISLSIMDRFKIQLFYINSIIPIKDFFDNLKKSNGNLSKEQKKYIEEMSDYEE